MDITSHENFKILFKVFLIVLLLSVARLTQAAPNCGPLQLPDNFDDPALRWHPYLQNVSTNKATIRWSTRTFDEGQVVYWEPGGTENLLDSSPRTLANTSTGIGFDLQLHEGRLSGLKKNTDYCYRIEHGGAVIASGLYFHTAWDSTRKNTRFIVFGDSGDHWDIPWAVRAAFMEKNTDGTARYPFDFWMGLGDLAYYSGTYSEFDQYYFRTLQGRFEWTNNLDLSTSFIWNKPTYHAVGNHEYLDGAEGGTYLDIFDFPIPPNIPSGDDERYYSFDYGNTHFISLDGNKFETGDYQPMLDWLANDLAASDAFWKIVILHQAPYSSGSHGTYGDSTQYWRMRTYMLPILQQYGVNLVFSGHDHLYQRSKRMKVDANGQLIRDGGPAQASVTPTPITEFDDGIVYVVAGNGGTDLHSRLAEPDEPGTPGFDQSALDAYGEGYDFVAKRPNGEPIIYASSNDSLPPTTPTERKGFTHVTIHDCRLTLRSMTHEHVELDNFIIDRCSGDSILVPDVVGLSQAAAEAAISGAGLTVGVITLQTSTTIPAGEVISQTPVANTSASPGSAVDLVVSSAPQPVLVPDVVGLSQAAAEAAISGAGLTVGVITLQTSTTSPAGEVISQTPVANTSVSSGSAVDLVVSSAPQPVLVPDVVGLSQAAAEAAISGAGLTVGVITLQTSTTSPAGEVISQTPAANTSVSPGNAVDLVVSSAPQPVLVPDVVGLSQAAAEAAISGAGLTVGVITLQTSTTSPAGEVISQTPVANTSVSPGSAVDLVVSSAPAGLEVPFEAAYISGVDNVNWKTVTLTRTYVSPVIIASPVYDSTTPPIVVRIRNAHGNSFELRLDRADGLSLGLDSSVDVHYLVVEEGVYTEETHGVNMEAIKFNSTKTDRRGSWSAQQRSYTNTYSVPVIVGQVMSYNDPRFSVFWSRGASKRVPPSTSTLRVGKHIGEDTDVARADETIGYLVMEAGEVIINDQPVLAGLGKDTIGGVANRPPYGYALNDLMNPVTAVVSQTGMDGGNGGWAILYGSNPISDSILNLAIDEDQINDSERKHTTEQVAYIVVGSAAATHNE